MRYIIIILILGFSICQEGQVTNVVAQQRTDGSHTVDISYDLLPDSEFPTFTVFPYISVDGGESFQVLNINPGMFVNVIGENVFPGTNKTFYWDHPADYDHISSDNIIFKITAYGHEATTLPESFNMIQIPAGDYMGYYYDESCVFRGDMRPYCGQDSIMTINYDYEIMKYPVTNAQFCTFLLELLDQGLIDGVGQGNLVWYDFDDDVNPYPVAHPPSYFGTYSYAQEVIMYMGTDPRFDTGRIYWNGETYLVEEGYANHPVVNVYNWGMELFAGYYGLRLVGMNEYIKAFRGMQTYDYPTGIEQDEVSGNIENHEVLSSAFNYRWQGDYWESHTNESFPYSNASYQSGRNTTPVDFFNGMLQNDYQTIDAQSEYGLYDMVGNIKEIVTGDAACHYAINECGNESDPDNQPVNSIGIATSKLFYTQTFHYSSGGGYNTLHPNNGDANIHKWNTFNYGSSGTIGFRCARTINNLD